MAFIEGRDWLLSHMTFTPIQPAFLTVEKDWVIFSGLKQARASTCALKEVKYSVVL
jgi:hypothetical protein